MRAKCARCPKSRPNLGSRTCKNAVLRGHAVQPTKVAEPRNFQQNGPLQPPVWAARAGFFPIRASYSYLVRLHRFGLLRRSRDARGRITYSLSERGRRRLSWLMKRF